MGITLLQATEKDVDAFLALERSVDGTPIYSAMTNREEALTEIKRGVVYMIKENNEEVGSIMYEATSPTHAHIIGLVVRPDSQGRGIGKAAMLKVLEELSDITSVDLDSHPKNERAIKLYESLGFTRGEVIENFYGDGEPRVVMTLQR